MLENSKLTGSIEVYVEHLEVGKLENVGGEETVTSKENVGGEGTMDNEESDEDSDGGDGYEEESDEDSDVNNMYYISDDDDELIDVKQKLRRLRVKKGKDPNILNEHTVAARTSEPNPNKHIDVGT
ncbi:hypothetical protein LguiA_013668 [Lonicera macranthoides]